VIFEMPKSECRHCLINGMTYRVNVRESLKWSLAHLSFLGASLAHSHRQYLGVAKEPAVKILPISPLSLACSFFGAEAHNDCATVSGGFSILHIARVKAASRKKSKAKK